jgi:hypothetical protein
MSKSTTFDGFDGRVIAARGLFCPQYTHVEQLASLLQNTLKPF